jgi:hypothetical protein
MVNRLTRADFDRAKGFIRAHARPLDRSLFVYHFQSGSVDQVIAELVRFQNADGGFGHGLEPDFRLGASSALATTVAFQVLRELGVPSEDPTVGSGIAYFLASFDTVKRKWPSTPKELNDEPHAPWWHHDGDRGNAIDRSGWGNPSAEVVACLREHASLVPSEFLAELTDLAVDDIRSLPDEIDVHAMLCYLRLMDTLPGDSAGPLREKLETSARLGIAGDADGWPGASSSLFPFAPTPESPLADVLSASMARRLDTEIERQSDDGSWEPTWAWGQYEDAWQVARRDWQGHLTLQTLVGLRAYGRIEGI